MMDIIADANSTIHYFNSSVGKGSSSQNLHAYLVIMSSTLVTSTLLNHFRGIPLKELSIEKL